ncbi:hypothetical protein BDN72DRAFT_966129 [Pluteus cervinus]|uniref:Uncharacterized protein n=1 Tax=Pluteus cervinus TaxID=181527 RepID=A0ACD3A0I9_9AGAR|nr:hypothetical protein BDN72DRAFT_966129 [Pluteus cervinus]
MLPHHPSATSIFLAKPPTDEEASLVTLFRPPHWASGEPVVVSPSRRPQQAHAGITRQRKKPRLEHAKPVDDFDNFLPQVDAFFPQVYSSPSPQPPAQEKSLDNACVALEGDAGFSDAIELGLVGFYQILHDVFVVQGWDKTSDKATNNWFHLQRGEADGRPIYGCCCPDPSPRCIHQRYLEGGGVHNFADDDLPSSFNSSGVIPFSIELAADESLLVYFSVATPGRYDIKSRAIVAYQGLRSDTGTWRCHRDQSVDVCVHIHEVLSQKQLLELIFGERASGNAPELGARAPRTQTQPAVISYLPILPPNWAELPSDPPLYQRPPVLKQQVELLNLDTTSTCPCNGTRTTFQPHSPTTRGNGILYTLTHAYRLEVELQKCPASSLRQNRFIGPDLRELGIFNFNNHMFFTHDLLDEYTSELTSSETPFTAWIAVSARRYHRHNSKEPFASEELFRSAWFAYVELQIGNNDMSCPSCGPSPSETIWDGVTLAFSRKHVLSSLQPPTSQTDGSPTHVNRPVKAQQLVPDASIRKTIRKVVKSKLLGRIQVLLADEGTSVEVAENGNDEDDEGESEADDEDEDDEEIQEDDDADEESIVKVSKDLLELVAKIPVAFTLLTNLFPSLGTLFLENFGLEALSKKTPHPFYIQLFEQIVAEESILQFANRAALDSLGKFLASPGTSMVSYLNAIPALYQVARFHKDLGEPCPPPLIDVCRWIHNRGSEILTRLLRNATPFTPQSTALEELDWKTTGCCYSLPLLRHRPVYPHLRHDKNTEPGGKRGEKCSKFYAQYGKKRLTGGIMCVWCTHSICYGFHFIPIGEGRNDVFSALYTRWPQPPKLIIYDFACALAPYCMTRESAFFADTLFGIDGFHAKGHTKCSPAAFLSNYSGVNPQLMRINSSAAECGNSGLARIRKAVSYMSQRRAIIYTRVFIAMWNRLRIRKIVGQKV